MFCQKAKFLQVHKSYYMKKKKKKKTKTGGKGEQRKSRIMITLHDCLFDSGLEHKQLREALMKKSRAGLNRLCKAAKGDVLAKLKAGNPRMKQGKTFMNSMPFKKLHTAYMSSAYKK